METLFDKACLERSLSRIRALRPESPRGWGRMDVAQMMAHCSLGIEASTGDAVLPRPLFGRFIGRFFKGWMVGPKPFSRNSPTHPLLTLTAPHDFGREHARLQAVVRRFHDLGPDSAAKYEHAFVGRLTGAEWGVLQAKHLDHHLRQFGA